MAKPSTLCRLVKGNLIDTFHGFVDTWNFIVDFIENLRGDGDDNSSNAITIDRTVPDHPVIKCSATGGSVDCDDLTTTTEDRSDGKLSVKGAYDADPGTVPHMKSDGSLEWKVPTSFIVRAGASGDAHTCTKALILTPGSNSNVSFTVTDDSDGTVTIAVDVYYK